jgi:hypothetical protein
MQHERPLTVNLSETWQGLQPVSHRGSRASLGEVGGKWRPGRLERAVASDEWRGNLGKARKSRGEKEFGEIWIGAAFCGTAEAMP